jgi:hypothetical protein
MSVIRSDYFGFGYLSDFVCVKCSWFEFGGLLGENFSFVLSPFIYLEGMKLFL